MPVVGSVGRSPICGFSFKIFILSGAGSTGNLFPLPVIGSSGSSPGNEIGSGLNSGFLNGILKSIDFYYFLVVEYFVKKFGFLNGYDYGFIANKNGFLIGTDSFAISCGFMIREWIYSVFSSGIGSSWEDFESCSGSCSAYPENGFGLTVYYGFLSGCDGSSSFLSVKSSSGNDPGYEIGSRFDCCLSGMYSSEKGFLSGNGS